MYIRLPAVRAEAHTDDFAYTAKFDAAPFLKEEEPRAIVALAKCGWGGDYPADDVARFFDGRPGHTDVTDLFADLSRRKSGFECHVHEEDAIAWLHEFRPDVFAAVCEAIGRDPAEPLPTQSSDPHWDRDSSWAGVYQFDDDEPSTSPGPR